MSDKLPRLRISTPTGPIPSGRGFYQLEEETLYVQIGVFSDSRPYFSYLASTHVRFEIDRHGRLIFIEYSIPRRRWNVDPNLTAPAIIEAADIRWLQFREQITEPDVKTNTTRTNLALCFDDSRPLYNYYLGDAVLVQVNERDRLAAIWILDIVDDLAGQQIGAFRKNTRHRESYFKDE